MRVLLFSCATAGLVKHPPSLIARQVPCVDAPSLGITLDGPRPPRPDGMRLGLEPPKRCASHKDAEMGVSRVRSEWTPDDG